MKKNRFLLMMLLAVGSWVGANAQIAVTGLSTQGIEHLFKIPKCYTAVKACDSITIDGKFDESTWSNAPWTDKFVDLEGDAKGKPRFNTRVKMAWDSRYLYVAAELEEPHIWGSLKEHDQVIFHDNDFEIFLDPDGDTHNYFEYEVNPLGTIFDIFLVKTYRVGGPAIVTWNFQGLKQAIGIDGTLNDPSDIDRKWTVEVAIPLKSLAFEFRAPSVQKPWRINFMRVEWEAKAENGAYVKETDTSTGIAKAESKWVWSSQGVANMHCPELWGYLNFANSTSLDEVAPFEMPQSEQAKSALWAIFYRQQEYLTQNGRFAKDLSDIGINSSITVNKEPYRLLLDAANNLYQAMLVDKTGKLVAKINNEGKIY
ncbi:carbohydrate-binding family 9-like protein [uncultured Acetobacteroides sp.]|uniref:carbohydrate-binding family 9-like protein n=1 Tax=uncultured Acetobacteroides sp. TaxID=1760811 RepID=UPI0029F5B5A1|nr:carbohydrate-binding family 9-like protein [uncultured Acetobacteroides sp.]